MPSVIAQKLLEVLIPFSSDLVGVVASYAVYPVWKAKAEPKCLFAFGGRGEGDGQFEQYGCKYVVVVLGPEAEYIFVGDYHRLQMFDAEGRFLSAVKSSQRTNGCAWDEKNGLLFTTQWDPVCINVHGLDGTLLRTFGVRSKDKGQFRRPNGIAVNSRDNLVYIVDQGNYRVQIFTCEGVFVSTFGSYGKGPGQFTTPWAVAYNPIFGLVLVSDYSQDRIQVALFSVAWQF